MRRSKSRYEVHDGIETRHIELVGRYHQTLRKLLAAGSRGITSADFQAGTRVSHYIFELRKTWGLTITTETEPNSGEFGGSHGRYRLETPVRLVSQEERRVA